MSEFLNKVQGLLGTPQAQDFATGLLSQSGYSYMPTTFGQAVGNATQFANGRGQERMRLQAAREQLEQRRAQVNARRQLPSAISSQGVMQPGAVEGLLQQAYPEAYGQSMVSSLLGQSEAPRVSTDLSTFEAINPTLVRGTPEHQAAYMDFLNNSDPQAALQTKALELQIQNEENEINATEETRRADRLTLVRNTNNDLRSLKKLYEMNQVLKPTFLATGGVMPEARRDLLSLFAEGGKLFGADTSEKDKIIDAYDTFKKEQENLANRVTERYGANTNARYQGVVNSIPNLGLNPAANDSVIARMIDDFIGGADDFGFQIQDRDSYESLLTSPPPQASPAASSEPPSGRVIDFSELPQ